MELSSIKWCHRVLQKMESWLSSMPGCACLKVFLTQVFLRGVHAPCRICGLRKAGGTKLHNVGPSATQK